MELLARIETLAASGRIGEAVQEAERLCDEKAWKTGVAERLFSLVRDWHTRGFLPEQKWLCELLLPHMAMPAEVLHLLGFHAQTEGDYVLAEEYYRRALALKPDFAFPALALAQLVMMRTGFAEGREGYEARFEAVTEGSGADWRGLPIQRWKGEALAGKHIYLWAEQGLGDVAMFAGFLPQLLAMKPARVALGMYPKLMTIFTRSFPEIAVEPLEGAALHALGPVAFQSYPQIEALAAQSSIPMNLEPIRAAHDYVKRHGFFDYVAPFGDLLVQFMPDYTPATRNAACLKADPERKARVQATLEQLGQGRRIGISWHTTNMREATRNIPLADWLPVLATPGCHFISLQHCVPAEDIQRFCAENGCNITIVPDFDPLQDAEGLIALIDAMDEVITIDNSNAHIAGALNVKTAVLLPKGCNFRWPEQADGGTLWYHSVKALRQQALYDWSGVMAQAAAGVRNSESGVQ